MNRDDFGDWLSPILVKEFRQGLRSWLFVIVFLGIQAAMVLGLSMSVTGGNSSHLRSAGATVFWMVTGLPLAVIWPLASLNAVSVERREETLELLLLTRLTPKRIILGKWFAHFARGLLLAVAVLPYLVFRYFIGGVDLVSELGSLALLLLFCALATLMGVVISTFRSRAAQIVAAVCCAIGLPILAGTAAAIFTTSTGVPWFGWMVLGLVACVFGGGVLFILVEAGAAALSPSGEISCLNCVEGAK